MEFGGRISSDNLNKATSKTVQSKLKGENSKTVDEAPKLQIKGLTD